MNNESAVEFSPQALNRAMLEAVEFIHAEGWEAQPTLFALVPTALLIDALPEAAETDSSAPLTLVVQDTLPEHIRPGSEELADYVSRVAWPEGVVGAILAQEIRFRDIHEDSPARPARLFSGVLRLGTSDEAAAGPEQTLLQMRPTEEELAERGPFAEDEIELRGGPGVAPGVIAALRYGLQRDPTELL